MFKIKIGKFTLYFIFLVANVTPLFGQIIDSLPPTVANDRYFNEVYQEMKRPGLSIIGFDNSGDHSKGYGLKQILNQVYVSGANEQKELFKKIIGLARDPIEMNPIDVDEIETNSNILQFLAFEALASYILEENGIYSTDSNSSPYNIPIRQHSTVMGDLKDALVTLSASNKLAASGNDYVAYVDTYMNVARAIDLYLAIENAYTKWEGHTGNTGMLLSQSQKQVLMDAFIDDIFKFHDDYVNKGYDVPGTPITVVYEDKVEPGNRPLKGHVALGYSVMAIQNATYYLTVDQRLNTAISRAGDPAGTNRLKYWNYQSSDGQRQWAEGAHYLDFALKSVVPFWHAVRANDLLGTVSDPFTSSWFLNPVEWMADISTPDGLTPPIDDGNKDVIDAAPVLRWSNDYGSGEVGKKFNYVYNVTNHYDDDVITQNNGNYNFTNINYLIELAIPKATEETVIDYNVEDPGEQQLVFRYNDSSGRMHYIFLNGEYGDAISRGEGHEQPDQLQLLYYIDNTSYLMDTGYDHPIEDFPSWEPSSFNGWRNHSVMRFGGSSPFLNSPEPGWTLANGFKKRVISDKNHPDITSLIFDEEATKVKSLNGELNFLSSVHVLDNQANFVFNYQPIKYSRKTLFIEGNNSNDSYLIDINTAKGGQFQNQEGGAPENFSTYYSMNYYINSNINSTVMGWNKFTFNNNDLFVSFNPIEYSGAINNVTVYSTLEHNDRPKNVKHIYVSRNVDSEIYETFYNTVAFINVSSVSPYTVETIFNNSNGPNYYQGWYLKQNSSTVDVFVKRSKINSSSYNEDLEINISDGGLIVNLELSSGLDYGFARLKKQNGFWKIDNNYKVNITQQGYFYSSNHTVGNYTYPTGTNIYVGDNVTLTFSGTVNLDEANVFLGKDAKIRVNSSGKIIAENTDFKRLNANEEYEGVVVYSDWNEFRDCNFQGGYRALYLSNSNNNLIYRSDFTQNTYGLYMSFSDALVAGGVFSDNDIDGIGLHFSDLGIKSAPYAYQMKNVEIAHNGNNGISMSMYSSVWTHEVDFKNGSDYSVKLDNTSRAYIGEGVNAIPGPWEMPLGFNNFYHHGFVTSKYVYNMALTNTGETSTNWIVPAQSNYWEDPDQNSAFIGPVDHSNPRPPSEYNSESTTYGLAADATSPQTVTSASKAKNVTKDAEDKNEQQKLLEIQKKLNEINTWMHDKPFDPENGRWLRSYAGLLRFAGEKGFKTERQALRGHNNKWLARFHTLNSLQADTLRELEQHAALQMNSMANTNRRLDTGTELRLNEFVQTSNTVGEVAVLVELEEALIRQKYDRVVKLYDKYAPVIKNTDNQYGLLSALSIAYQGREEYGAALGVMEELERLKPDKAMAEGYEAPDFTDVKAMLADSAKARSQEKEFLKATPGENSAKKLKGQEIPDQFRLANAYPNPFNPATTIAFDLPEAGPVRIEIFNVSGRLVSVLTNQTYQPGRHQLTFNADGLASGVYLVRAQYAGLTETRKITLLK